MLYTLHRAQALIMLDIFSRQIEIAIKNAYGLGGLVDGVTMMVRRVEKQNLARESILQQSLIKTKSAVACKLHGLGLSSIMHHEC
jgi:hypothetical protein